MSTLRQMVSDIRSRHKLISYDNRITDRVIASELRSTAYLLLKRETNLRRLWDTDTIFTTVPCLEMVQVPLAECCDYTSDKTISRSKYQLPKIAEGNYQYLISGVYNIEGSQAITYISLNRYINYLKLSHPQADRLYYWISNRYLYCTSPDIKKLKISAFFEGDLPYNILNPDCGCGSQSQGCISPLDMDFNLPGYLEANVKDIVTKTLMETYQRIVSDKTSDDNEPD